MGPPPAPLSTSARARTRTIIGASSIGAGHARAGLPCQDAFRVLERDEAFAIAVADGLGSARRSDVGAAVAVDAAAARALQFVEDPCTAAAEALIAARDALELLADIDGCALGDLACTLLVAAGTADRAAVAHIGDGAAVGLRGDEPLILSPPGSSEYLNEVDPLTADDWEERVRWASSAGRVDALALFTDGCHHAAVRRINGSLHAHAGFFVPLFDFVRSCVDGEEGRTALAQLLSGGKMSEHSDDDKTLVLAVF